MKKCDIGILAGILICLTFSSVAGQQKVEPTKPIIESEGGSEAPADVEGRNKIVAIRRLTLMVDDIDSSGDPIKRGIPYVEIELQTNAVTMAGALTWVFRIGPWDFNAGGRGCPVDSRCRMINITPEEFDALKDGDLISMRYDLGVARRSLVRPISEEPQVYLGTGFGKLDKSLINRCEPVVRKATDN